MGKKPKKPETDLEKNLLEETSYDVEGDAEKEEQQKKLKGSIEDLMDTSVVNPVMDSPEEDDASVKEETAKDVSLGKIISELEETSLDVDALSEDPHIGSFPDTKTDKTEKQGPSKGKLDFTETDEFEVQELDEEEEAEEKASEGEEGSKFHQPASILDLIKGGGEGEALEIIQEDSDLETRIEGKSLDEVLKVSQKKDDWHESEKALEGLIEKQATAKKRQRKLLFATPLILLAAGVACFYIILPTFEPPPEADAIKLPKRKRKKVSPEKLKIDPNLKDEEKLNKYLAMGDNLFKKKRFDKAEIVYQKLLPTGWNKQLILGKIGSCRDKAGDQKGAVEFFSKAIAQDYTGDVAVPLRLANILYDQGKYQEILYALEPVQNVYSTNIELQSILAEAYWEMKMPRETLATFRKINKQYLTEKQLKIFAKLLLKQKDKREAFNVYLFLGQNFNDLRSLFEASKIAPNPNLRIAVLTELVGKNLGKPDWNKYNMLLGEAMFRNGQKKDALKVLESIKPEKLDTDNALKFLRLVADFEDSSSLVESCESLLAKNFLNSLPVQIEIRDILFQKNKQKMAKSIFKKQVDKNPRSAIANFMYASIVNDMAEKIKYYEKALLISSEFYSAAMALGKIYCGVGDWNEAIRYFKKCVRLKPTAKEPRYWIVIVEIRKEPSGAPLDNFAAFLKKNHVSESEQLKDLISLAQYLPKDSKANEYLQQMAKFPKLKKFMDQQTIRTKLIYGTLKESDFAGKTGMAIKRYRILFLLGEGKINQVMMMPTLKNEFPEYWKVFICWRKNISSWRGNAELLEFKNPDKSVYILSAKLWQWEMSPVQAEKQIASVKYEERPLLYFMMAERYRKDRNKIKSSIFYQTAIKFKEPNIYKGVVKYFKNH